MPMTRYYIRSEYSLADPRLYTASDKDDPEALLEGVAMSGLVGLLRQLGDLSEFAAMIFHELHDEVMVTATRGHNLVSRVQQLEAQFLYIEKAFLSQTDHSSFVYNAGVDWHPNLQMDQNLVTLGNLPRFIMDSYEECRGPPRLFLLDKFDTAGAGACLKRYTDPSFFKRETPSIKMNDTDIQREKKIRRAKHDEQKKGSQWRNGGTPEVLPLSHAKLHQLLMEDYAGNGESNPAGRVKLKRRLNGFPFDLKNGQSYMEKILKIPPEHKVLQEITMNLSSLRALPTTDCNDSSLQVLQVRPSADRDTLERKRSPPSPQKEDIMLKPTICEPDEVFTDEILKEDNSYSIVEDNAPYTGDCEKDMAVHGEIKGDDSLIGYLTDDFDSEINTYVDAPMAIESELDADSEFREKTDITSSINRQPTIYDVNANEERHFHSSDSQSTGNSMLSDDENHSSRKEISSFSSSYIPNISADSARSEHYVSADISEIGSIGAPYFQKTADENCHMAHHTKSAVSDDMSTGTFALTNHCPDSEQQASDRNLTDLDPIEDFDSEYILREVIVRAPETGEKLYVSDEEVNTNLAKDPACSPSFSDFNLQSEDNPLCSPLGVNVVVDKSTDRNATCTIPCLSTNSPVAVSFDFLQADDSDQEDLSGPEHDEKKSFANREEKKENMAVDPECSFNMSDSKTQSGDNFPSSSTGRNAVKELNSENELCSSTISHISCDATAVAISSDIWHNDKSGKENLHLGDDVAFMLNNHDIPPNKDNTSQMSSTDNPVEDELHDGDVKLPENYRLDYPDSANDGHSFMSALIKEEKSIDESDNEALNVFPDASNVFSLIIEASLSEELEKTSPGNAKLIDAEELDCNCSVYNQICSPNILVSHVKCSQDWSGTGLDTHDGESVVNLDKETTLNELLVVETLKSCEVLGLEFRGITDDAFSDDLAARESLCSNQENFVQPDGTTNIVEKDGITQYTSSYAQEAKNISVSPELTPLNDNNVLLNKPDLGTDESQIAVVASSVLSVTDIVGQNDVCSPLCINHLVEDGILCFEDLNLDKLENGKNCLLESQGESCLLEEVGQRVVAPSDLDRVFCNTISYNHPKSEESETILHPELDSIGEHTVDFINTTTIQSSAEQKDLDPEQKLCQQQNLLYHDVHFHNTIETTPQEQASSLPNQLGQEFVDSGEIDTGSLPLLATRDQHILDFDDHQAASNSSSKCSLVNCPGRPLIPELPALCNCEVDVSDHSNHPLGSMFPLCNCLLEASSINLEEFPPLPPLPPVQWRLGKVQHASSTIQGEIQHEEFSQGTSSPITSTGDVSSFRGELNGSMVQFSHDTIPNKEKVEHSPSMQEINDLPSNAENEEQQVTISSLDIEFALTYVEDVTQIAPNIVSSKEDVEHSSTDLETSVLTHETVDHKQKAENVTRELIVPSSVTEFASQDMEERIANESQTRKLPLPRNPLIDTVTALDKSKLRKVTRVRAEMQKVEERDSLLEQIRTKSFSLKPALATKPSIRGPKTNLKVAAILEKANAIRQALAGSDEDDEDSWSDS